MKITILGSGSAYGVPMIFNIWGNADSSNPQNHRTRASILLEDKGKSVLIDCGPDFREQINKNNVKNIDAVFITHGHYDHIAGIPELPRASKILGHGIDVCATRETMQGLKQSYGYLFKDKAEAEPDSKSIWWRVLPENGEFSACGLLFQTFQVPHHHIFSSVFRYQNFAYITDWQNMPAENLPMLQNLDVLLVECNNGYEKAENGHSDMNNVKKLIADICPKKTILSHISARVDDKLFKKERELELAYDGMVIEL